MDVPAVAPATRPSLSLGGRLRRWVGSGSRAVFLGFVALAILVPLIYAAVSGLRDTGEIRNRPVDLPTDWFPHKYIEILTGQMYWQELFNSVVVAAVATTVVVTLAAMAAFAFARLEFPGREKLYTLFVLGLLFPVAIAILPLFILVRQLGLLDNPLGVALPLAAFGLPLTVVILRPFFRAIPVELEDAARMDGCSTLGFFWRVVLPLSKPALATVSVLAVVGAWNAFLLPLVVFSTQEQWTLPLGVMNFSTQYTSDTARVLAYTTLSIVPALLFYVVAERQIVRGLTAGSVKG
ncbi:MAG: carbohydrate ABC transporter permease [Chloroflexota bacterium]